MGGGRKLILRTGAPELQPSFRLTHPPTSARSPFQAGYSAVTDRILQTVSPADRYECRELTASRSSPRWLSARPPTHFSSRSSA